MTARTVWQGDRFFDFISRHRLWYLRIVAISQLAIGIAAVLYRDPALALEMGTFFGIFFAWSIHEWWSQHENKLQAEEKNGDRYIEAK